MIFTLPIFALVACVVCLLIAVILGAYRQWCKYLWVRTAIVLVANAGEDKPQELRLGAYVPGWKSPQVRVGSWFLVTALSILGAALAIGFDIQGGLKYLICILLIRSLLSAIIGRAIAGYTLRVAQSFPD
ncbi:MAG: hypothetical protein ACLQVM_08820 [Terriglobia bacterium]